MSDDPLLGGNWSQIDQERLDRYHTFWDGVIAGVVGTLFVMLICGAFQ